ncbi:MAG: plastocyanin/azurin family copper-binding protein, partial [Bacteroidota bacterium]
MKYFFTFLCLLTMICSTRAQTLHIIESGNFFYEPTDLTIQIGDTVRWINVSGFHNVNAEVNTITGENFNNPESFFSNPTSNEVLLTRVFTVAGRYEYDCSVGSHAASGMVGSLTVEGTNTTAEVETALTNELGVVYHSDTKTFALNFYLNTSSET